MTQANMGKTAASSSLIVLALGIVYSDIGTSVLYSVNELFYGLGGVAPELNSVIGAISLLIWILTLVISLKYALLVLRADNRGEGGPFALMGLLHRKNVPLAGGLTIVLIGSAALLFAESVLTPAISITAAIEGLRRIAPWFEPHIVAISIGILLALFAIQRKGTARIGRFFGPIALCWFVCIGTMGLYWIIQAPIILHALNPFQAASFLASLTLTQLMLVMGAVVLVITGGEALFADLGHIGKRAIRRGWFGVVYPSLLLNYLGQGAYMLGGEPVHDGNVFYSMVPVSLALPAVLLATAATIIACQALISADFSLGAQAIARGLAPRLPILHTSDQKEGQIYMPHVNWALCCGSILLVAWLQTPSRLAAAYGLAVSGVMLGTSIAMIAVSRHIWHWPRIAAFGLFGGFAMIDILFFGSNMLKFFHGGFIPLLIGMALFLVMLWWQWGSAARRIAHRAYTDGRDVAWLVDLKQRLRQSSGVLHNPPRRDLKELDCVMIFMTSQLIDELTDSVPITERIFQKRFHAVAREAVFLTVVKKHVQTIPEEQRITVIPFPEHVTSVQIRFGFLEKPDLHSILERVKTACNFAVDDHRCVFAVGQDNFIIADKLPLFDRLRLWTYQRLVSLSLDGPRYLGIISEPGLTRVSIPIRIDRNGWRVDIPESAFEPYEVDIDPDTRKPTDIPCINPNQVDPEQSPPPESDAGTAEPESSELESDSPVAEIEKPLQA